jgi:hypothetical protein
MTEKRKPGGRSGRKPPGMMTRAQLIDLIDTQGLLVRILTHCKAPQYVQGEDEEQIHNPALMSANQLKGADMLLRRSLPEVRFVEQTTDVTVNGDPASLSTGDLISLIASASSGDGAGKTKRKATSH